MDILAGLAIAILCMGSFYLGFYLCYRQKLWEKRAEIIVQDEEKLANVEGAHRDRIAETLSSESRREERSLDPTGLDIGAPPPMPQQVGAEKRRRNVERLSRG